MVSPRTDYGRCTNHVRMFFGPSMDQQMATICVFAFVVLSFSHPVYHAVCFGIQSMAELMDRATARAVNWSTNNNRRHLVRDRCAEGAIEF